MDSSFPDKKKMCHRTGFEKSCRDLLDDGTCQGRWVNVQGRNPQTDEIINKWGCVDDQAVLIQLSMEARLVGVQAAIESRGNDTIKMLSEGILRSERNYREMMALGAHQDPRLTHFDDPQQMSLLENNPADSGERH